MPDLMWYLRKFNRKERFFLTGMALGNPDFVLSSSFCTELDTRLGINVPKGAFCAMDYHLDWLYASLVLHFGGTLEAIYPNDDKLITANQEDIDLLIAYPEGAIHHLILLEAKGVTGWSNKQMRSKANRLQAIFEEPRDRWLEKVKPHFAIVSPRRPRHLDESKWPKWMQLGNQLHWIELRIPDDLLSISRCNNSGKPDKNGTFWTVLQESYGTQEE